MYWTLFLFVTLTANGTWFPVMDNSYSTQAACQAAATQASAAAKAAQPSAKVTFACSPHAAQ